MGLGTWELEARWSWSSVGHLEPPVCVGVRGQGTGHGCGPRLACLSALAVLVTWPPPSPGLSCARPSLGLGSCFLARFLCLEVYRLWCISPNSLALCFVLFFFL